MPKTAFTSPEEAEDAYYRAFEKANLEAMMRVWLDADYVECIHPMSHRLVGIEAIRDGWQEIFSSHTDIQFETVETRLVTHGDLAVHIVNENFTIKGKAASQILATNIYEKTAGGWHMILHHASPAPRQSNNAPTVH